MAESESRTQLPTQQKRQQAREQGLVAHSPELTGAAGLLTAVLLLGLWGDPLASALIEGLREPLASAPRVTANPAEVVARLRDLAFVVAAPLGLMFIGVAVAAVGAHQLQVGGFWAPALLAPDPARLWRVGAGNDLAAKGVWSLVKTAVVLVVAAWAIRTGWHDFQRLGGLQTHDLARVSVGAVRAFALRLALVTLVLGLIDFAVRTHRFEAMLRMTPEEHREDQRAVEGDPALRARRRNVARAWRGEGAELLAGAAFVLTGPNGLTLVLAGGPPPHRVSVRSMAQGSLGLQLRRTAEASGLTLIAAPELARSLSMQRTSNDPLAPEVLAELAAIWPL